MMLLIAIAATLFIPPQVEASSDTLLLGDIARIVPPSSELAQVSLGYAPYAGQYRWMVRNDIESHLRSSGIDTSRISFEMDERVLITRQSRRVSEQEIRTAVEAFLNAQPDLEVSIQQIEIPAEVVLPRGEVRIEVDAPARLTQLDQLNLKLNFYVDRQPVRSQWARVHMLASADVVVAVSDIPFGQRLRSSDLKVERRKLDRLDEFFYSADEAAGTVAKLALRQGDILRKRDVRQPTLVSRGDVVTLVAGGQNFAVTTLGRSRDQGLMGEIVRVENLDSRQLVNARVIGENKVQVQIAEGVR